MQTRVTARAIILDPKGRMLILRRSASDPLAPGTWDIPGGRQEQDERFEHTALREAEEETGLQVTAPELLFATSDMRAKHSKTWLFFTVRAKDTTAIRLSREHDGYQWIKPSELDTYTDYDILLRFHTYIAQNNLLTA